MSKKLHKRASALSTLLWLMLLALLPAQLSAQYPDLDFTYTYEGQTLSYKVLDAEAKTVKTIDGFFVDEWGVYFPGNGVYGDLIIPETVSDGTNTYTVTEIGDYGFYECAIDNIFIPNTVTTIGRYAFAGPRGLFRESVFIPASVNFVGNNAFQYNEIVKFTYPEKLSRDIRISHADAYIEYPEGTCLEGGCLWSEDKSILYYVPVNMEGSFIIPDTVTAIKSNAFFNCHNLSSVFIPKSVGEIAKNAFDWCYGLKKSAYPSSLNNPFKDGGAISYPAYNSLIEDGIVWSEDRSTLYFVPTDVDGEFTLPETVEEIGEYAFSGCDSITAIDVATAVPPVFQDNSFSDYSTEIIIPDGSLIDYLNTEWNKFTCIKDHSGFVSTIFTDDVFNYRNMPENEAALIAGDYSDMTSVSIPERVVFNDKFVYVTVIMNAFTDCAKMSSLVLPKRLKIIGDDAFHGCKGLTKLNLPESVTTIGNNAFRSCYNLEEVNFPESLTTIGHAAFAFCENLNPHLNFPESLISIGHNAFNSCFRLTDVTIDSNLEWIGNYAFYNCKNLTAFQHKEIDYVGKCAFQKCQNLDNVTVDWPEIAEETFGECSALKSLTLTDEVTLIGDKAFNDCDGLASFSIPSSVTSIGSNAFYSCSNMRTFILEDGIETLEIGDNALQYAPIRDMYIGRDYTYSGSGSISVGITSLTYGNAVTSILDNAFNEASGLRTVNFGTSIETIGENAFNGCAFTELILPPNVKTVGNYAFANNAIRNIAIGSEVTEIGEKAFDGANQLEGVSITALTPPMANNNTFSYYDCPLYVTPGCVDTYYNFTRCWYRFSGYDLIVAEKVTIKTEAGNMANITLKPGETMKFSATMEPADASLPYIFWRSTNPAFATVDQEGVVTLVGNNRGISTRAGEEAEAHSCEIIAETLYADVVARVTVMDDVAGVEDIVTEGAEGEAARPNDIYNLQGVCLKRNASQTDIDALVPGLYIIGGKKVLVK